MVYYLNINIIDIKLKIKKLLAYLLLNVFKVTRTSSYYSWYKRSINGPPVLPVVL